MTQRYKVKITWKIKDSCNLFYIKTVLEGDIGQHSLGKKVTFEPIMRSEQYRDETETKPSRLRQVISLAFIAAGCFFGYRAISSEPVASQASRQVRQVMPSAATTPKYHTSNIEDLRVGDWVLSGNPEVTDHERETFEEIDPGSWRKLELRMEKRDGGRLDLVLLRPVEWVNSVRAKAGGNVHLDLPELGAEGNARIVSIGPSPDIVPAPSTACQLVTGTFAHSSGEILDIRVEGLEKPIGVTANHPFYSEDAKTFVPAGKLSPGELLRQANGRSSRVIQITKRTTPEPVFNLEVNGEHTYHISKTALLVHNNSAEEPFKHSLPDKAWSKKAPKQVTPGTKRLDHYRYNERTGKIERSVVEYDDYGRQIKRIDFTDHGYPESHKVPHIHKIKYDAQFPNGRYID